VCPKNEKASLTVLARGLIAKSLNQDLPSLQPARLSADIGKAVSTFDRVLAVDLKSRKHPKTCKPLDRYEICFTISPFESYGASSKPEAKRRQVEEKESGNKGLKNLDTVDNIKKQLDPES